MAIFSNQATLTVGGTTTNSNIAYGEILEVLTLTKNAVETAYALGQPVTYVVTLRNTGTTALTNLTLTDDLGGYTAGAATVYPLTPIDGTVRLYVSGVLQAAPTVTAGPPLVLSGINVPAGTDAVLIYQARTNGFADPSATGTITNTVTVTGGGLTAPITAQAVLPGSTAPQLTISKSINPTQVTDNDRVTYTFVIQNAGNQAVDLADNAVITDTFDPILSDLAVTFNGAAWTQGTQYTYDQATGLFSTVAGQLSVPAATFTQDPATGAYTVTPGLSTLTVIGTI